MMEVLLFFGAPIFTLVFSIMLLALMNSVRRYFNAKREHTRLLMEVSALDRLIKETQHNG